MDLNVQILFQFYQLVAALSEGTTEIINAGRLRIKECDRLAAVTSELNKLGAKIIEKEDGLIIKGVKELKGGVRSMES